MSEEMITLHDGPAHGRRFAWSADSGDRLEYLPPGGSGCLSIAAEAEGFRDIAHERRAIYVRSVVTSSVFVWQP